MKRLLFALLAGGLALQAWPARADDPSADFAVNLGKLDAARNSGDCNAVLPVARQVIASPAFADAGPDLRGVVLVLAAGCAGQERLLREALDDARLATAIPGASAEAWRIRLTAAMASNAPDEFVDALEQAAVAAPEALTAPPLLAYRQLDRTERIKDRQLEQRMLAALDKGGYRPDLVGESADDLWLRFAQLLVDAGDNERAGAVLAKVSDIRMLMQVKLDARFATAVAAHPDHFDLKAAAERKLAEDQATMAAHPELLGEVEATLGDFDALNRYDEAVATADAALDRVAKQTDKPAFIDEPEKLSWIYGDKAVVLLEMGRVDDAIATERTAVRPNNSVPPDVSHVINLALFLNLAGRSDEALKALDASLDNKLSPYGLGWLHTERACADQQLGRTAAVASELAYLSAHAADNPGARIKALLCVNDLDAAAAAMIVGLRNPDRRGQTLINLSTFARVAQRTPISAALHERLVALQARPDVRAAVAAAGHTEAVPLNSGRLIDVF
ncbi:MAG TPA: hypothetical protein VKU90_00555 [Caulobacteraceae bacterium]|nr:hypothetical protein [Caulobacteraceae bacterium]